MREFIHYSRKPSRQQGQDGTGQGQGDRGRQVPGHGGADQYGGGHRQQGELSLANNRFALPGDGVPGGPQV